MSEESKNTAEQNESNPIPQVKKTVVESNWRKIWGLDKKETD